MTEETQKETGGINWMITGCKDCDKKQKETNDKTALCDRCHREALVAAIEQAQSQLEDWDRWHKEREETRCYERRGKQHKSPQWSYTQHYPLPLDGDERGGQHKSQCYFVPRSTDGAY